MKGKRILSIVLAVAMILSTMGFTVLAEDTDIIEIGTGKTYETWSAAVAAAADADIDGAITYQVYGKVIMDTFAVKGEAATINIIGMTDDAELCVETANSTDNGVVYVYDNTIETVNFSNLKLSRPNGEWKDNEGHHNRFFTVWDSDGSTDLITYTNCVFSNGAGNNQYGKTTYTNCTFNNDVYYALWIYGSGSAGIVEVTGCTFDAARGVKIYSEDAAATVSTKITESTFDIADKPAIVSSIAGELVVEDVDATACEYGLLASEPKDGRDDLASAAVTVDGETPVYVAKVGNLLCTDMDYAEAESNDTKPIVVYVAKIGDVYYESLHDAMVAAKANQTVELVSNVDLKGNEWEPVSFKGKFDGNDYTISNLNINKPAVSNTGFITSLNSAFENVSFKNVSVIGGENTGVVAGRAGGGAALAKNITINGTIKVETTHEGYARLGGIVGGWAYGRYINITVDGGNAETSYLKHSGGGDGRYVAGIVGHADDVSEYTNCVVKNITIDGGWLCGGIAGPGPASSIASGCVVENIKMDADYSGGMFGWFYTPSAGAGVIEDCTIKNVEFTDGASNNGAIGGYGMDSDVIVSDVTIENVVNYGGAPLISYKAAIGENLYADFGSALSAAVEGDVIDLLGNIVDLPETNSVKITKDVTIENGTIDITNGVWNGNSIIEVYGGTANDFVVATFNNVDFVGDNYSSAFGVIYAYNYGKVVINGCDFDLSNEKYSAGGVLKGNGADVSAFDVTNSTFDLENPNRIIANATVNLEGVEIDAVVTDDTLVVGEMNNHAFRNLVGTVNNSDIYVAGFETGIKNTSGNLVVSGDSLMILTNSADTDLVLGADSKVEVKDDAKLYADTSDIADGAEVAGEGFIAKAEAVYVQFKKTDVDGTTDTLEGADTYEIILASANSEKINELASADLTIDFNGTPVTGGAMDYTIAPAEGVALTKIGDRYMFNYDGVTKYEETGAAIVIGTITVDGYGAYTLATKEVTTNAVYATEIENNIVEGYEKLAKLVINTDMVTADGMVGEITDGNIAVPTRTLTINLDFPNAVVDNVKAYQDMKVEITGNIDGVNKTVTYNLGTDEVAMNNGSYVVTNANLVLNNAYTVTVAGAGYRTARYTVTMTDDKQLKFWNNVMDEAQVVEIGKDSSVTKVTFLAGDIVKDNKINIYDLSAVVSYFGTNNTVTAKSDYAKYDLNRDGKIDSKDVAYVLVSWGK